MSRRQLPFSARPKFTPGQVAEMLATEQDEEENISDENGLVASSSSSAVSPSMKVSVSKEKFPPARPEHRRAIAVGLFDPNPPLSDDDYDPLADSSGQEEEVLSDNEGVQSSADDQTCSSPDSGDLQTPEKTRKRKRKPKERRKYKQHLAYQSGEAYITPKGKEVQKKELKQNPCSKSCKFGCSEEFDESTRQDIMDEFYSLKDAVLKWTFISNLVDEKSTQPTRPDRIQQGADPQKRNVIRKYFFTKTAEDGAKIRQQVCQSFFMGTLVIGNRIIITAMSKTKEFGSTSPDKRGGNRKKNKYSEDKQHIKEHIASFPVLPSHYCRAESQKQYLEAGLSVAKMYRLYLDWCHERDLTPATYEYYRSVFNFSFNVAFHKPKKDQCMGCNYYKTLTEEEKVGLTEEQHQSHLERVQQSRDSKAADKVRAQTDKTFSTITFDLQKVLTCPAGEVSLLYYTRKLSCYNFTIFENASHEGYCYFYDESAAGRGSNEVATGVWSYIQSLAPTVKHLSMFSDTCGGQNRNSIFSTMCLAAVRQTNLEIIDQKYMESGHSDMEVDSMHSTIERMLKHKVISAPFQYPDLIKSARQKKPGQYHVTHWQGTEVIDWKYAQQALIKNKKKLTGGGSLNWLKVKWIQYRKSSPNSIYFKYGFGEDEFLCLQVAGKRWVN